MQRPPHQCLDAAEKCLFHACCSAQSLKQCPVHGRCSLHTEGSSGEGQWAGICPGVVGGYEDFDQVRNGSRLVFEKGDPGCRERQESEREYCSLQARAEDPDRPGGEQQEDGQEATQEHWDGVAVERGPGAIHVSNSTGEIRLLFHHCSFDPTVLQWLVGLSSHGSVHSLRAGPTAEMLLLCPQSCTEQVLTRVGRAQEHQAGRGRGRRGVEEPPGVGLGQVDLAELWTSKWAILKAVCASVYVHVCSVCV